MKHIKKTVSVFAALALASGLSGAAYAAQTYLEEPASAGRSTGAVILALAVAVLAALLILVGWWARGVVDAYHAAVNTPIVEAA